MVNKAAVIALAVVVFTSLSVGGLLGMQLATKQGDDADLGGDSTTTQTDVQTQQPGAQTTEVATTERPSVRPNSINETRVELLVYERINAERKDRGVQTLRTDKTLVEMATYHTDDMVEKDYYSHTSPSGETAEDRYRNYGLYEQCKILDNSKGYYHRGAENIGRTTVGMNYTVNGEQRINENEQQVADALVNAWLARNVDSRYVVFEDADEVGVGVRVTDDGIVYATATYC
ncbi:CAP domain-containing protein [Haladaptatus sp. DYSN1]|uniref:CAP domain-containing protein n=1 Tax=unclassified Haladaptatus TaxID=2622732 RepID=UPI002405AC93|nr:CAP domain-containing protein [Haladaptatus sp. DYSN1]